MAVELADPQRSVFFFKQEKIQEEFSLNKYPFEEKGG